MTPFSAEFCYINGAGHYRTFDGFQYDFEGFCSYNLFSYSAGSDRISIDAKNVRCNSQAEACSKSLTVTFNSETYVLSKGKSLDDLPALYKEYKFGISKQHFDTILHSVKLGITIVWNGLNTAIYITKGFGQLKGMCGDADGVRNNDVNVRKLKFSNFRTLR